MHVLDNPVWSALTGPHQDQGEVRGRVARYHPEVSLFGAFAGDPGPEDWSAMGRLVGPEGVVITTGCTGTPPPDWSVEFDGAGVQMTGEAVARSRSDVPGERTSTGDVVVVPLGAGDVDDMLELVALARPGPFTPRTWELGGYVGVRHAGRLVAMAGERMRPVGWGEISAVATHPDHRRQGLGELLVREVAAGIVARGDLPMLHASADNTGAIRLYGAMGFTVRRHCRFVAARFTETTSPVDPIVTDASDRRSRRRPVAH